MKKAVLITFAVISISIMVVCIIAGFYVGGLFIKYSTLSLDNDKLTSPSLSIEVFDNNNRPIKEENMFNGKYIKQDQLPKHVKDAFISIEDKTFYTHHGINYKRIAKAMLNNIKSLNLKEGASTISQQLIKNTHLSSEKTLTRKIKEVALTKKLENNYSKDDILEQYLNIIYFGNNCYGIEKASNFYFSKSAHDLSLEESATLAGIIKSPSKYSPINNPKTCEQRRNVVLNEMEKDGKISTQQYMNAKAKGLQLNLNRTVENRLNSYSEASIDEAKTILGLSAREIALRGYQLHTYQNHEKQEALEKALKTAITSEDDNAGIVIDNKKHSVDAYFGKSAFKIINSKRQPGSCIKPILVYGPALNEDIISPCTQLLDEKTVIAGYSPKNVGEKYRGYVSAREALAKSINIPAVKVLSYVGIDKAKNYAENLGIEFVEGDDNYALALGGMCFGTTIKQLADAYSTFANMGKYSPNKFISYITDKNDKLVYVHRAQERQVFREDSTYLLNDMLRSSTINGTAKKLASLNLDIASKTGTVGKSGSAKNLDAWNISYTDAQTCAFWVGNLDNTETSAVGGGTPTQAAKNYFESNPDTSKFSVPNSIVKMPVDTTELQENHRVVLANSFTPERYTQEEIFSRFNLPAEISKKFTTISPPDFKGEVCDGNAVLTLQAKDYYKYSIYRESIAPQNLIAQIQDKNGKQTINANMPTSREKFILVTEFCPQFNSPMKLINQVDLIKSNSILHSTSYQKIYI